MNKHTHIHFSSQENGITCINHYQNNYQKLSHLMWAGLVVRSLIFLWCDPVLIFCLMLYLIIIYLFVCLLMLMKHTWWLPHQPVSCQGISHRVPIQLADGWETSPKKCGVTIARAVAVLLTWWIVSPDEWVLPSKPMFSPNPLDSMLLYGEPQTKKKKKNTHVYFGIYNIPCFPA